LNASEAARARVRWAFGEPAEHAAVEAWLGGAGSDAHVLRDNPRRRLVRLERGGAGGALLVKHFRVTSGRHALRERIKARIGRSPADREAGFLAALSRAGVRVPPPLALGALPDGDRLLVLPFLEGRSLAQVLTGPRAAAHQALERLGVAVAGLHRAGFVHGDLHGENLLFVDDEPFLLDLQHARRTRSARARLRDLGDLDYSLWDRASRTQRLRLRAAALGGHGQSEAPTRDALRAVGAAARARALRHGRSRTRRLLRPGRQTAALELERGRGLRWRDFPEDAVRTALEAHAAGHGGARVLEDTDRSRVTAVATAAGDVIVKQVRPRGIARLLADALRGSPARRAWRAGHGLLVRGIGAARPLAFVEHRHFGVPRDSWVVLEDVGGAGDALQVSSTDPDAVLDALGDLLRRLHRREVEHGDLKATHVFIELGHGRPQARLVDLEGVRFRRRLTDTDRLRALAELNASLPDRIPARARLDLWRRYVAFHPFAQGPGDALDAVVRQSLERGHRWSGADCACARRS